MLRALALCSIMICVAMGWRRIAAEPLGTTTPQAVQRSEAEFAVAPQGGAFEIPLHAGSVCILSFPDKVVKTQALVSSDDFEIKGWGDAGVAIRALVATAKPSTLAVATASGSVKVNLTLTVVAVNKPALTLVRFKAVSAAEAFDAQLKAAVATRVAPLESELADLRKNVEKYIRSRASEIVTDGLLKRNETIAVSSHGRNGDNVIVHIARASLLGDDGYLVFEIENRSAHAYRIAGVRVFDGDRDVSGAAKLTSLTTDRDPGIIGVVPNGATARGLVAITAVDRVLGKNLTLVVTGPAGSQPIRIDRGIVLR